MGAQVHHSGKLTIVWFWGYSENNNLLTISCFSLVARSITPSSNPGFTLSKVVSANNILLGICNHSSAFEMYDVFRVRNDTGYLTAWSTNFSSFPNLLIKNTGARDPRRYHCDLNYQGTKYVSDKYVLTWKGNTIFSARFWISVFPNLLSLIHCFYEAISFFIKNQGH